MNFLYQRLQLFLNENIVKTQMWSDLKLMSFYHLRELVKEFYHHLGNYLIFNLKALILIVSDNDDRLGEFLIT